MPCSHACRFDLVGGDVLVSGAGPIGIIWQPAVAKHVGARNGDHTVL
jgi:threonine dehydrogenase-like Zn-dependent dehydrogenase